MELSYSYTPTLLLESNTLSLPTGTGLTSITPPMELSGGATPTLEKGKPLNCTGIVDFRVINWNLFRDYSAIVKLIPPFTSFSVNEIKAITNIDLI
jgi:hypothetical protein